MNKAMLVGRITKDPELRKIASGNSVVNFTIAINRTYTNAEGQREADFINCQVWGRPAENMVTYVSKGALIGVEGRIQTRSYDGNDGKRVYVTEVVAESVQFLETRNSNNNNNANNNSGNNNFNNNNNYNNNINNSNSSNDFFGDLGNSQPSNNDNNNDILAGLDISDDELPF